MSFINQDTGLTYWRHSGKVYAGKHWDDEKKSIDPTKYLKGIASLRPTIKDGLAEIKKIESKLIATAKQVAKNPNIVSAAEGSINADAIVHLQQIQLIRKVAGLPASFFHLDEAFMPVPVPMLELREPVRGVGSTAKYTKAHERANDVPLLTTELKYDIEKIFASQTFAIEDIMRTVINPTEVTMTNMIHDYASTRNLKAAEAIKQTAWDATGKTGSESIGDPATIGSAGFHSENKVASKLSAAIGKFTKAMRTKITHVALNPNDFAEWTENTWTSGGFSEKYDPTRLPDGGVVSLPGLPKLTGVVDLDIPEGNLYCFDKENCLRLAQGPMFTDTYKDYERQTNVVQLIDFVDYVNIDGEINHSDIAGRYFSFRASLS